MPSTHAKLIATLAVALATAATSAPRAVAGPFTTTRPSFRIDARYFVRAGSLNGDGTSSHPFATVGAALGRATAINAKSVTVELLPGTHTGNVVIDRPTTLRGWFGGAVMTGTVYSVGSHPLTVSNLKFQDTPTPAAIVALGNDADVTLRWVTITRATHYGVIQRGGVLDANELRISDTRPSPSSRDHGTGLLIGSRTEASLTELTFVGNSQGVILTDSGTRVAFDDVDIRYGTSNPSFTTVSKLTNAKRGYAAFEVRDGATAIGSRLTVSDNAGWGVSVVGTGRLRVTEAQVSATRSFPGADSWMHYLGTNVSVREGGILDAEYLDSADADSICLQNSGAFVTIRSSGGPADLTGELHGCPIGIHFNAPAADPTSGVNCILGPSVRVWDNGTNLQSDELALPSVPSLDEPTADPFANRTCYNVAW